jgi:hypothetical protein
MRATKINEVTYSRRDPILDRIEPGEGIGGVTGAGHVCPYEAAERAGVAIYGLQWVTLEQIRRRPHIPFVWCAPADNVEPEPLAWMPAVAIRAED